MKRIVAAALVALSALSACASAQAPGGMKGREILGLRVGGVYSTSGLDEAFGSGSELEIYFYHGLTRSTGLGIALSGHNFGRSRLPEKDLEFLGIPMTIDYMLYSVTGCYMARAGLSRRLNISGELGGGLYTSTMSIPVGALTTAQATYNRFGFYAGSEIWIRLTKGGGLHLGLGAKWHYVFTGTDFRQPVYVYTGNEYAHFYEFTVGVSFLTDD
jgi:hypothetical protein